MHFQNSKTTNYIFFFSLRSNERSPHICLRGQEGSNGKNTESKNEALFVPCYNIIHYGTTWQQFVRTLFKNTVILFVVSPKCCIMKHCFQFFLRRLEGQQRLLWYFLKKDFWTYSQNHRWNGGGYLFYHRIIAIPTSLLIDCPGQIGSNCKSLKVFKVY